MFLVCEVEDVRTNSAACLSAAALCAALRCQARTLRNFTFYWTEEKKQGWTSASSHIGDRIIIIIIPGIYIFKKRSHKINL